MIYLESYKEFQYNETPDKVRVEKNNKSFALKNWIAEHPLEIESLHEIVYIDYFKTTEGGYSFSVNFGQYYFTSDAKQNPNVKSMIHYSIREYLPSSRWTVEQIEIFKSWIHKAMLFMECPLIHIEKTLQEIDKEIKPYSR